MLFRSRHGNDCCGVPLWTPQQSFPWRESAEFRVDAFIPPWKLIVEADGRHWHTRVRDFEIDRGRDNLAVAHGLGVMRFTHSALTVGVENSRALLLMRGAQAA